MKRSTLPVMIQKAREVEAQMRELSMILERIISSKNMPILPLPGVGRLTKQENKILRMVRSGMSFRQIADELKLSARTVESHIYNAKQKQKKFKFS